MSAPGVAASDLSGYRMKAPGRRGDRLRPLMFRPDPAPIPGESLLGLVARATTRNGYPSLLKVIRLADIGRGQTNSIPAQVTDEEAERLAYVMKVPTDEVVSRLHRTFTFPDREGEFINFFGVMIQARYREKRYRRISPLALRRSPHHRAIHDLAPFSFCPETMETLLDRCPICRRHLQWGTTRGIAFCESCRDEDDEPLVDLRDHPQPLVEVDDEAGLRLLTDLVDPDPARRAKAVGNVDPALAGTTPGDLFELAIMLARAAMTPSRMIETQVRSLRGPDDCAFLTPHMLSVMGRTLMEWQVGIGRLCDQARERADERPRLFGAFKEIGHLRNAAWSLSLTPALREAVRMAFAEDMRRTAFEQSPFRKRVHRHREELVDTMEAAAILGVKHAHMPKLAARGALKALAMEGADRTLTLYDRAEVEAIAQVKRDMTEATKAARAVGLPVEALEALADAGMVARAEGPALLLGMGSLYFRQSTLDALVASILDRMSPGRPVVGTRRICSVLNRLPPGDKPWLGIVRALASGELAAWGEGERLVERLFVDEARLTGIVLAGAPTDAAAPDEEARLSYREVAPLIGMPAPNVTWLVAAGLLGSGTGGDRRITRRDVRAFNESYASTAEVARTLGVHPSFVKRLMAEKGIEPAAALHKGNRLVWRRAEVFPGQSNPSRVGRPF
ncbi:TniQ family protein [Methylobacterium sp. B4]|uniref:TniQ family protein n=1 Tax=Methylobacterium sp. B4 TaxID=1938755 RepID=UPI000D755D2E|nr:TniQ family protein [Methylobacterium sp. B4]PXW62968.1 TniQ protein [Methylobacterium sp. B4]